MPPASAAATPASSAGQFLAPVFSQYPLEVAAAHGVWLTNSRGERVLDLYGGHAVAALGYGHPAWTAALARQAQLCQFQSNAVALAVRARVAERLVRFAQLPESCVFFVNSGAEANENALKIALRTTGRRRVAAIEGAFHGRTAAAGAVTWGAQQKWYGFPRAPFDVSFIPRGDRAAIHANITRRTAAVIVEPVQGVAGAVELGEEFLGALRARCDAVGALLIFDEVQCGVGRTGQSLHRLDDDGGGALGHVCGDRLALGARDETDLEGCAREAVPARARAVGDRPGRGGAAVEAAADGGHVRAATGAQRRARAPPSPPRCSGTGTAAPVARARP